MTITRLPVWSIVAPLLGAVVFGAYVTLHAGWLVALAFPVLLGCVLASVQHAEIVAHRIGQPYGTLVLAVAVTAIEVGLILTLMAGGGPDSLARDTVFAAVMIILNGIVGLSLLAGGSRHREQLFHQRGVNASLATLATLLILTLVLPDYTIAAPGAYYDPRQLGMIAAVSLVLYLTFVVVQTVRHRDYFLTGMEAHEGVPTNAVSAASAVLLLISLVGVVLLAKAVAPAITWAVDAAGAPPAVVGIIIAAIVLLPEGLSALKAARADQVQTTLNLSLGSAIASIGLTIPAVAVYSLATGTNIQLGIGPKGFVLLGLSLFVTSLSLGAGATTVLQGVIHLAIFATYLAVTVVP